MLSVKVSPPKLGIPANGSETTSDCGSPGSCHASEVEDVALGVGSLISGAGMNRTNDARKAESDEDTPICESSSRAYIRGVRRPDHI